MKIAIGSDHAGFGLKQYLLPKLREAGYDVLDLGCESDKVKANHVKIANELSFLISSREVSQGILICGTGIGMAMAANRHRGIRAAVANDGYSAVKSKEHNHANILCLGARVLGRERAELIIIEWLKTEPIMKYQAAAYYVDQ